MIQSSIIIYSIILILLLVGVFVYYDLGIHDYLIYGLIALIMLFTLLLIHAIVKNTGGGGGGHTYHWKTGDWETSSRNYRNLNSDDIPPQCKDPKNEGTLYNRTVTCVDEKNNKAPDQSFCKGTPPISKYTCPSYHWKTGDWTSSQENYRYLNGDIPTQCNDAKNASIPYKRTVTCVDENDNIAQDPSMCTDPSPISSYTCPAGIDSYICKYNKWKLNYPGWETGTLTITPDSNDCSKVKVKVNNTDLESILTLNPLIGQLTVFNTQYKSENTNINPITWKKISGNDTDPDILTMVACAENGSVVDSKCVCKTGWLGPMCDQEQIGPGKYGCVEADDKGIKSGTDKCNYPYKATVGQDPDTWKYTACCSNGPSKCYDNAYDFGIKDRKGISNDANIDTC